MGRRENGAGIDITKLADLWLTTEGNNGQRIKCAEFLSCPY